MTYSEADSQVSHFILEKRKIPVIPYSFLIVSKISTERIQDKADVEMLQNITKSRKNK